MTTTPDTTTNPAETSAPTLMHLDPATLKLEVNVRDVPDVTPEFVATIKAHGVIQPVIAYRHADGDVYVRMGQRRTLGAIEAGCETIPVYVLPADPDMDDRAATALRIVQQYIENEARSAFTDTQRTTAFTQLSLMGMSIKDIAAQTGTDRKTVSARIKVGKSATAAAAQADHGLTLDQALALIEFEDDPETVDALTLAATDDPEMFDHIVQRARDERADAAALAEALAAFTQAGVTVVERPDYDDEHTANLTALVNVAEDGTRTDVDEEAHTTCPGHAAWAEVRWGHKVVSGYVCTNYTEHGHQRRYTGTTTTQTVPATEAEKAEKAAERRRVIENNKAWRSAETVRREWLTGFAARKTAPKNAGVVLAHTLTYNAETIAKAAQGGHTLAAKWLGINQGGFTARSAIADLIAKATPARAQQIALTIALAAIEDQTGVHTWRHPGSASLYLTALAAWGYGLSDVEKIAAGIEPDQADDGEPTDDDQVDTATE